MPDQTYVLHLTPKEIVYTTDPNLKKLYNAVVDKDGNMITINIVWLKGLYIQDMNIWSNVIFAYKCLRFSRSWAQKTNLFIDSMLMTITCTKDNKVEIKPYIMNIVKPKASVKATSKHMIKEVSKLYNQLKMLQKSIAERNEVFVTSWGIPLKESDVIAILRLVEDLKER